MKTANDKAPDIVEKTKIAISKTRTVTLDAYGKATDVAKKATGAIEEFIEKQMHPDDPVAEGEPGQTQIPSAEPIQQ